MSRTSKWVTALSICAIAAVVLVVWVFSGLLKCKYSESSPTYSPDQKFYTQMQFTLCQDHTKSHIRLIMGATGKPEKSVLLDLGPSVGELHVLWHEGPELHVQVPESAITKRYGPYEDLPRVVVTNP